MPATASSRRTTLARRWRTAKLRTSLWLMSADTDTWKNRGRRVLAFFGSVLATGLICLVAAWILTGVLALTGSSQTVSDRKANTPTENGTAHWPGLAATPTTTVSVFVPVTTPTATITITVTPTPTPAPTVTVVSPAPAATTALTPHSGGTTTTVTTKTATPKPTTPTTTTVDPCAEPGQCQTARPRSTNTGWNNDPIGASNR